MAKRTSWDEIEAKWPLTEEGRAAYDDEARISAFRELVYRLRTEAGFTQAELAERMGTTQSAIALRMEEHARIDARNGRSVRPPRPVGTPARRLRMLRVVVLHALARDWWITHPHRPARLGWS